MLLIVYERAKAKISKKPLPIIAALFNNPLLRFGALVFMGALSISSKSFYTQHVFFSCRRAAEVKAYCGELATGSSQSFL